MPGFCVEPQWLTQKFGRGGGGGGGGGGVRLSLTAEYNSTSDSTRVQQCHDNNHVIFYLHVCMYTLTEF